MNWWRAHHGISNDSKLAVVALRAGVKKGEVLSVWVTLLDYASQNEQDRGSAAGMDAEQIAIMTDFPLVTVESILSTLRDRGLIQQDAYLTAWPKRQPKRERDDDDAAERKRRQRAKSHHVTPENEDVTPRHTQSRGEESRGEEKSQNLSPTGVGEESQTARDAVELTKRRPQKVWFDEQHTHWYADAYWCRKGKADSRKAYEKAINRLVDREGWGYKQAAIALLSNATEDRRRFEGTQDWDWRSNLHPATWLNQERWTDEVGPEVQKLTVHQERNRQTHNMVELLEKMKDMA